MQSKLPMHQRSAAEHGRGAASRAGRSVHGKARCRMHGDAASSGALRGNQNALRHRRYAANAIAERRRLRELLREARELIKRV